MEENSVLSSSSGVDETEASLSLKGTNLQPSETQGDWFCCVSEPASDHFYCDVEPWAR